MTHRDRAGDPSGQRAGRRKAAGDAGHRQGLPTPSGGSPARPERRLPKAFGRRPASPRHALLAENLRKPSLWLIISAPWYYMIAGREVELRAAKMVSTNPPITVSPAPGRAGDRPHSFALIRLTVRSMDVSKILSPAGKWLRTKWRPA